MKQINFLLLLFVSTVVFYNCNSGPTPQELQRIQQAHDDSVKNAAIEQQKAEAAREAAKLKRAQDKETLLQLLASLDADLQGEETRMESVKSFQLLRTSAEKEEQVRNQAMRINEVKLQIENVKEQLRKLENGEEYVIPGM
jgi:hypothetical protein